MLGSVRKDPSVPCLPVRSVITVFRLGACQHFPERRGGGAIPHYVWVSSTVNCQPFVCLSIHLIANNHYPVLSSWQMIDVVLKSDGWPCHSDVQACIKNHLYEMPVSLMKRLAQNHTRACVCVCARAGILTLRNACTQIKERVNKVGGSCDTIQQQRGKKKEKQVNFFILVENFIMWQDLWCDW